MKTKNVMIVGVGGQGSLLASKLLGNLLTETMESILDSQRAKAIFEGFSRGQAAEELCRKCGYARRFQR